MEPQTPPADPTPLGTPPVPTGDAVPGSAAPDDSLAAHEAAHGATKPEPEDTRDEQGRFQKPRRRAQSQQADADDVPTINALTARLKAAEDAAGKDIVRQDGESERVFTLRRRAELAERHTATPAAPAAPAAPIAPAPRSVQQPIPQAFPTFEQFVALDGLAEATYEDYLDARHEWRDARLRARDREQDAADKAQRTQAEQASEHGKRVTAARKTYADWDAVVTMDLPISRVLNDAVLASSSSADVQYYLGAHRDELAALVAESQDYSPSAVQAMRRYLDTLVAPQRSSPPSRAAAGSTGSALALAPTPVPRPPNPVRTGPVTPADDPPGDGDSLAAHEQFYGRRKRG